MISILYHVFFITSTLQNNTKSSTVKNYATNINPSYKIPVKLTQTLSYPRTHDRTMDLEIFGHLPPPPTRTPIFTLLKQGNDHS